MSINREQTIVSCHTPTKMLQTHLVGLCVLLCTCSLGFVAANANETRLTVAVGNTLPPYSIAEFSAGIELDIVRTALYNQGYQAEFFYVPFARLKPTLLSDLADAALTLKRVDINDGIYYSEPHIQFENVVVTLKSKNIDITSVEDLQTMSVLAFQNATVNLGPDFAAVAKENARYWEIANQQSQVSMLFLQRSDALVIDRRIFDYYHQRLSPQFHATAVTYHPIFEPTDYHVGFTSKTVRDDFNTALEKMHDSGEYQQILDKYSR